MERTPGTNEVCREFDDVTSAGKLFHVRAAAAAATRNARSVANSGQSCCRDCSS